MPSEHDERELARLRRRMVERQLRSRGIGSARVLEAMGRVPRHRFVGPGDQWAAYDDRPLTIGQGQTISQPYMVARMTELLDVDEESRVLEIGAGSGYQAAVLAEIVRGVWTVERHPDLAQRAEDRLREVGYVNVHVVVGDGTLGLPDRAPFEGIIVTAAAPYIPMPLKEQLAEGGRLVIPVGGRFSQWLTVVRREGEQFPETEVLGCQFVPLIGEEGYE